MVENLYGYDHNKLLGASVALAAKSGIKNSPFDNEYSLSFSYKDLKQVVLGTIGEGNVTAASINGDLNRDLNNAEQETGSEIKTINAYYAETNIAKLNEALDGIGEKLKDPGKAIAEDLGKIYEQTAEYIAEKLENAEVKTENSAAADSKKEEQKVEEENSKDKEKTSEAEGEETKQDNSKEAKEKLVQESNKQDIVTYTEKENRELNKAYQDIEQSKLSDTEKAKAKELIGKISKLPRDQQEQLVSALNKNQNKGVWDKASFVWEETFGIKEAQADLLVLPAAAIVTAILATATASIAIAMIQDYYSKIVSHNLKDEALERLNKKNGNVANVEHRDQSTTGGGVPPENDDDKDKENRGNIDHKKIEDVIKETENSNKNNFEIEWDKQGKHINGDKNFIQGRSELTYSNPQKLIDKYAGKGNPANSVSKGEMGYRERFEADEIIGIFKDELGNSFKTNKGIIHYSKNGVHIVPGRP